MAINATPDGFCDHRSVVADDALHSFYTDLLADADTMLFGRKTFQLMDPYWPDMAKHQNGEPGEIAFAKRFTAIHKIVFSEKGLQTDCPNTSVMPHLTPGEIIKLKEAPGKNILVGSPSVVDQLTEMKLIDEFIFVMHPVIPGNGKRFFESTRLSDPTQLVLLNTIPFPSGAIALFYTRAS